MLSIGAILSQHLSQDNHDPMIIGMLQY